MSPLHLSGILSTSTTTFVFMTLPESGRRWPENGPESGQAFTGLGGGNLGNLGSRVLLNFGDF
jgi:hypothetical protein